MERIGQWLIYGFHTSYNCIFKKNKYITQESRKGAICSAAGRYKRKAAGANGYISDLFSVCNYALLLYSHSELILHTKNKRPCPW